MVKVYCITLDSLDVVPGGVVTGRVSLETEPNERIKARGVRISLLGQEKVHITRTRGQSITNYYATRELINERVTVFGWPKGFDGDPVFLEGGRRYSFPFMFNVPSHCLPSCQSSDKKKIWYRFDSCVDRPWKFDLTNMAPLRVLPNTHVDSVPPSYSTELKRLLAPRFCWCLYRKGLVGITIKLEKAAHWWGEEVPVDVLIDNSRCNSHIESVQVAFFIVSTYEAESQIDTHKHRLAVKEFPLPNGAIMGCAHEVKFHHRFDMRRRCDARFPTSTIHGEYITHEFLIKATAKYRFAKRSVKLPIYVADGPSRSFNPQQHQVPGPGPSTAGATPVNDPRHRPDYFVEESGQMPSQMPIEKWPENDAPMFERTK